MYYIEVCDEMEQPEGCYPIAEFVASNLYSEDVMDAVVAMVKHGVSHSWIGGGAAPLVCLSLTDTPDPAYGLV